MLRSIKHFGWVGTGYLYTTAYTMNRCSLEKYLNSDEEESFGRKTSRSKYLNQTRNLHDLCRSHTGKGKKQILESLEPT
jgi:hypothetical protein